MSKDALGRLMLVEDEHVLRGLVHEFLTLEGYDVEPVADGHEAVAAYAERGPFDLILLDLNLPLCPGVEACRQIRLMNHRQPFLVCSASILESHVEALHALDVFDTLGKPYHPGELISRIREIMGRTTPAAGRLAQAGSSFLRADGPGGHAPSSPAVQVRQPVVGLR